MDWKGRVQGLVITNIIFSSICVYIIIKNNWIRKGLNIICIKQALNFGIPLIPHALGQWAISATDRLLITNLINVESTGIYVVGAQIGMIIGIIQEAFNKAWTPWLFERLKKNEQKQKRASGKISDR